MEFIRHLTILNVIYGMSCIKVVSLDVPSMVKKGSEVQLNCLYDLGNATLYSLKWFYSINDLVRDEKEFYRFTPRGKPVKQVFPLKGLDIDYHNSNGGSIKLMVTDSMSGNYKCEISAEGTFHTVAEEKLMTVEANSGESLRPLLSHKLMLVLCASCAIALWITSYYSSFVHISDYTYCSTLLSSSNASVNQPLYQIKHSNHNQIIIVLKENYFKNNSHVS